MTSDHVRGLGIALAGVLVLSPDTLLVRLTGMESWPLAFWRGFGIVLTMTLVLWWQVGRVEMQRQFASLGRDGLIAGLGFSISNVCFLVALDHTAVANVLAMLALTPMLGAILSRFILSEQIPGRTLVALVSCLAGVLIILQGGLDVDSSHLFGDLMAICAATAQATAFVMLRRGKDGKELPALVLGGCFTFFAGLAFAPTLLPADMDMGGLSSLLIVAFLVIPASFILLGVATRYIPVAEITMIMLLEMVLGPLLVWLFIREAVPENTLIGGTVLFITLALHAAWPFWQKARQNSSEKA